MYNGARIILDFETTNTDFGSPYNQKNEVICAAYGNRGSYTSIDLTPEGLTPSVFRHFHNALSEASFIVAHNAKFECGWLVNLFGDEAKDWIYYDTMLAEYVLLGNRKGPLSLEDLSQKYLGVSKERTIADQIQQGINPKDMDRTQLMDYCITDVANTEAIFNIQMPRLRDDNLVPVVHTRCMLIPVLEEIERNGMQLDTERVEQAYNKATERVSELREKLDKITGGVNLNSPKQKGVLIYETLGFSELVDYKGEPKRTPSGGRMTDATTLASLRVHTKEQREFLELYKEQSKISSQLSKYLTKMRECCHKSEGKLYAQFNQAITRTHRLSSTGLNYRIQLQNMDRSLKPLFTTRSKDYVITEADASQLEFRVAVELARDKQGIRDIYDGVDVHSVTREVLSRAGDARSRTESKPETFKPLYGGTSGTRAQKAYYQHFREKYSEIYSMQSGWVRTVLKDKKLVTPWGLMYYWPDTHTHQSGYVQNQNSIFNYPIQGFATAEIIPIILYCVWKRLRKSDLRVLLVNTVHDSIVAEVFKDDVELFRDLVVKVFKEDVYDYLLKVYKMKFEVPLGLGYTVGTHWADKDSIETKIEPRMKTS